MKLSDLSDLNKEDILSALGLASKPTTSERLWGTLGIFGVGLLVGGGAALLLAPKTGEGLREDLGERFRKARQHEDDGTELAEPGTSPGEART
jgi:hypothetical protein